MDKCHEMQTETEKEENFVYYTYKDRIFRLLFKDRKRLLELYNALNGTDYTDEEDLTVNTLENAIYIKMKNDISFIIDCSMCLYEHQSTYCPNMPLRGFLYFADLYKKQIRDIDLSVRKLIRIPTPHYIVFYNGTEKKEEEFSQKLSDAFEDNSGGCIELIVRTININLERNRELLKKCESLYGYAYLVAAIRRNLEAMELEKAVETAIEECIEKDILKEFLLEQKAEVMAMSIYEYNEEYVRKTFFEDGREEGYSQGEADGRAKGKAEGREEGKVDGREEGKAEALVENVESIMKNMKINLQAACEGIGITVETYKEAKEKVAGRISGR